MNGKTMFVGIIPTVVEGLCTGLAVVVGDWKVVPVSGKPIW